MVCGSPMNVIHSCIETDCNSPKTRNIINNYVIRLIEVVWIKWKYLNVGIGIQYHPPKSCFGPGILKYSYSLLKKVLHFTSSRLTMANLLLSDTADTQLPGAHCERSKASGAKTHDNKHDWAAVSCERIVHPAGRPQAAQGHPTSLAIDRYHAPPAVDGSRCAPDIRDPLAKVAAVLGCFAPASPARRADWKRGVILFRSTWL